LRQRFVAAGAIRSVCRATGDQAGPDRAAAKRAFDAMMEMTKIDIARIEAALRG